MKDLVQLAKECNKSGIKLPFSVYSSTQEQKITNVPVLKPLLIFVLSGEKRLGKESHVVCPCGNFVFLSNSPNIDMRNVPDSQEYFAVLIEFEYADFAQFNEKRAGKKTYFQGDINRLLQKALQQYMELSTFAPEEVFTFRRKELLQLIYLSGHQDVVSIAEAPNLSQKIHGIISENIADDWSVDRLANQLSMSESTLRRKLKAEGTNIQDIRNQVKLGYGLHLLQTTMEHIGRIAERCGYQSQSRFTDQFKQLFGMTPSELRKTRMHD